MTDGDRDDDYGDEDEDEDYDEEEEEDEDEDEDVLQVAGGRRALHTVKATCEGPNRAVKSAPHVHPIRVRVDLSSSLAQLRHVRDEPSPTGSMRSLIGLISSPIRRSGPPPSAVTPSPMSRSPAGRGHGWAHRARHRPTPAAPCRWQREQRVHGRAQAQDRPRPTPPRRPGRKRHASRRCSVRGTGHERRRAAEVDRLNVATTRDAPGSRWSTDRAIRAIMGR